MPIHYTAFLLRRIRRYLSFFLLILQVIEELKQVQAFWLGAGVHGFSIDSANLLVVNLEANAPDKEKIKVKKIKNQCSWSKSSL